MLSNTGCIHIAIAVEVTLAGAGADAPATDQQAEVRGVDDAVAAATTPASQASGRPLPSQSRKISATVW